MMIMSVNQAALTAILLLFLNASILAAEQIFRCVQADGNLSFQKTQCAGQGKSIELDSVQGGWVSLRSGEKSLLKTYRDRDAKRKQRSHKAAKKSKKSKPKSTAACWSKRKGLDAVNAKLRRGYKPSQGEGLRRQRANYEEYLDKFCPK
jgi:hypothetical protein